MLSYVSLVWNPSSEQASAHARRLIQRFRGAQGRSWSSPITTDGFVLFVNPANEWGSNGVQVLPAMRGAILGKCFERSVSGSRLTNRSLLDVPDARAESFVVTKGQSLVDKYWGSYVAFLLDQIKGSVSVVRDPTGGLPCQWVRFDDVDVYFVRLEDCEPLDPSFSVNTRFLLAHLLFSSRCGRDTGLNEVETVLAGECVEHSRGQRTTRFLWNPLEVSRTDPVEDFQEAAHLVRKTVRECVHTWASCYDGITLLLSGGLDSSVVLASMADAPTTPRILCRNFYADGPNSDEREFARLAAAKAHVELQEDRVEPAFRLETLTRLPRSLVPAAWPIDIERDEAEAKSMRSRGFTTIFNGHGGDELFFRVGSFPSAVDYAWSHGIRPSLFTIALDDATLDATSIWNVLRLVRWFGMRRSNWHPRDALSEGHMPLMTAEAKRRAYTDETLWHPLYRKATGVPPGKLEQCYLITFGAGWCHIPTGRAESLEYVSPLNSQPIIELCLRIPLYVLRQGGQDRAVERAAFIEDLPREIGTRRSKAFGDAAVRDVIAYNIDWVRSTLLDGLLVRERIVDRGKLEQVLSNHAHRIQSEITEICDYLAVETWWQQWRFRKVPDRVVA
jgi:asparagine synthase (glutamine-hydrolysing)